MRRILVLTAVVVGLVASALPAGAAVRLPGELLPDGETRPVIRSVELMAPGAHNRILEADLVFNVATDLGIRRYEYRWNRATFGAVRTANVVNPKVSYETILPNTAYVLEVRAVDRHGRASDWRTAWSGVTPAPPLVVVAGDSVASGYQKQWFSQGSTCRDEGYSYGSTAVQAVAAGLPQAWAPRYVNIAWPGAGVGDVLDGGSDSCSTFHPSQVDQIVAYADPGTWNTVVVTAGINSTNWVDVVTRLTRNTALSLTDSGDKRACQAAVANDWNLDGRSQGITDTTARIVEEIATRSNASLYWTSYYELAGTRIAPLWSPIGYECAEEMDLALGRLHDTILAGMDDRAQWIDLTEAPIGVQKWAGWPHPNPEGHAVIGLEVAGAISG